MADYLGISSGDTTGPLYNGTLYGLRFQAPVSGNLTSLQLNVTTSAGNLRFGVYADSAGAAGALLLDAGTVACAVGWVGKTGLTLAITSGTYYWLAVASDDNIESYRQASGAPANCRYHQVYTPLNAFPNPFGTPDDINSTWIVIRGEIVSGGTGVTPEPAIIAGMGDQPAPTLSGSAVHAPNHVAQLAALVDPTLATTRNLGVGNYRSTTVLMNW